MKISPVDPIGPAWDRMVRILFKPFDLKKWFVLGFCAFLARCGEGGGTGGNAPAEPPSNLDGQEMRTWFEQNLELILFIGICVTVLIIAITILVIWLNSRGKFMLIDGIVKNRGAVVEPWREYRAEGNSLFRFRLVLTMAAIVVFLLLAGIPTLIALPDINAETFGAAATTAVVVGALFLIAFITGCVLLQFFIGTFVVPTMYLRRVHAIEGCRIAWCSLVKNHLWPAGLLGLMMIIFGIGASTIALLTTCLTCCLTVLPYIGTVILLPIPVFFTAYALSYLEQYGDDWRFFPPDDEQSSDTSNVIPAPGDSEDA